MTVRGIFYLIRKLFLKRNIILNENLTENSLYSNSGHTKDLGNCTWIGILQFGKGLPSTIYKLSISVTKNNKKYNRI